VCPSGALSGKRRGKSSIAPYGLYSSSFYKSEASVLLQGGQNFGQKAQNGPGEKSWPENVDRILPKVEDNFLNKS
jgi:hypothetical protein